MLKIVMVMCSSNNCQLIGKDFITHEIAISNIMCSQLIANSIQSLSIIAIQF